MRTFRLLTLSCILALLIPGLSAAGVIQTNEISNPGFDSDFFGWGQFFGRIAEWSSEDADGSGSSGSALVSNKGTSDGVVPLVLFQCVQVSGNQEIEWGGDLLVPNGQPSGTGAFIFVEPFTNSDCSDPATSFHSASSSVVGDWVSSGNSIITDGNTQSVRLALGVFKPNGETADAQAFFDNIYLYLPASGEFLVNPSMSASWFNPEEGGHGIMIHLLDGNTAWMCWFTFTLTGERTWICALGTIEGDTLIFDEAFLVEGGAFPPNFDPSQIEEVPWGSIIVVFTGCNNGFMTWTTSTPGFTSGSMPLIRLTSLWGVSCLLVE